MLQPTNKRTAAPAKGTLKPKGRCVANPEALCAALSERLNDTDLVPHSNMEGEAKADDPVHAALLNAATRAALKDDAFEPVGEARADDPAFVSERLNEAISVWRFTELPWELQLGISKAGNGIRAVRALAGTDGSRGAEAPAGSTPRFAADTMRKLRRLSLEQIAHRVDRMSGERCATWKRPTASRCWGAFEKTCDSSCCAAGCEPVRFRPIWVDLRHAPGRS